MTQQQQEEVNLLKELIADTSISAEERMIYEDALSELMQSEKPKASVERKPKTTTERKPRTTTQRKPQAPKQSKSDIESAKAEIKRRTGKTEEECESIVNEYRSLRAKSVERKKKETIASADNKERVDKLKKDDKIISGTNEKTADAVIESTTKDVTEKIVKEIEKIEKVAEVEATKEVEKEMPKESITEQNKAIAEKTEEKVKEVVKRKTKNILVDTSDLLTSIAETLGKFDKDSQKVFLIKLRSDIDKLLTKFSYGGSTMGATQTFNITQSNMSSSSVNPTMFVGGGGVGNNMNKRFLDSIDPQYKLKILISISRHYGISIVDAEKEVTDIESEALYEYVTDESLRMKIYNDMKNRRYGGGGGVDNPSKKEMLDYLNMYFDNYSELRTIAIEEDNILTRRMLNTLDNEELEMAYDDAKYEIKADTQYELGVDTQFVDGGGVGSSKNEKIMLEFREETSDLRNQSYPRMSLGKAIQIATDYMSSYTKEELIEAIKNDKQIEMFGMESTWINAVKRAKKSKMENGGGVHTMPNGEVMLNSAHYKNGGGVGNGYMVFNYTDNLYASNDTFATKKEANDFIKQFKKRFEQQGYYRDSNMNKIDVEDIDLLVIEENFNPMRKFVDGGGVGMNDSPKEKTLIQMTDRESFAVNEGYDRDEVRFFDKDDYEDDYIGSNEG